MSRLILLAPLALVACIEAPTLVPLGTNAGTGPARTIYLREFTGRYSPAPICSGQELQVELAPESVYLGETACNIAAISSARDGVELSLSDCRAEGAAATDRSMSVTRAAAGQLRIRSGPIDTTLQPCLD